MDNQHRKISGYRELDPEEVALMNKIKAVGNDVLRPLYDEVLALIETRHAKSGAPDAEHYGWAFLGRDQYRQGLMSLTRAVAAPDFE